MRFLILLLFFLPGVSASQDAWKNIYSQHAWEERDKWQKPEELIALLGISGGDIVADLGCHEGYMTFKLSRRVGEKGLVYAVDIEQGKLDKIKKRADENGFANIRVIKGSASDPRLPENSLDAVLILDTYHEMERHDTILLNVKKALKKGGRLLLCEAIADERRSLTRQEQEKKHELAMPFAVGDLEKAGFQIEYRRDDFIDRTKQKGDRMWVLVAVKP